MEAIFFHFLPTKQQTCRTLALHTSPERGVWAVSAVYPAVLRVFKCLDDSDPLAPMITWKDFQRLMPWEIVILVGGGYALAAGCKVNGHLSLFDPNKITLFSVACKAAFTPQQHMYDCTIRVQSSSVLIQQRALSLLPTLRCCWFAGVGPVHVDWQTAGAHERPAPLGRHPAGLPAGVGGHWVRLQPGDSHRLPAHPVCTGTTHILTVIHALGHVSQVVVEVTQNSRKKTFKFRQRPVENKMVLNIISWKWHNCNRMKLKF